MFSIIMPVWNRADLVCRSIESVIGQTYKEYELLIIDDGSEDNLEEVIQPYLSEKVIYHKIEHCGASAARNYALKKAKFPFIAYIDSDNVWYPEYLEKMYNALNGKGKMYQVAYCKANRYRKNSSTGKFEVDDTIGNSFSFSKLLTGNFIDLNTFVHSRKIIEHIGPFDEKLKRLVDWDLIIRATSLFEPVFVPETLVDYYYCFADNALSLIEDFEQANLAIQAKYSALREPVTLFHDGITYSWQNLPEKKYYNWVHVSRGQFNTDEYTSWGYPYMLQIEPTNTCNLECTLCPVGKKELGRKARHMSLNEFKSIIDNMKDYLMFLVLWDWGEPFMNPEFPEMIRYAAQYGIQTVTSTNAHFLNNDTYVENILKSGLTTLIIALDSINKKNYELYRKRGDLDKVLSGVKNAVRLKKQTGSNTIINLRTVVMKQNEHELKIIEIFARKVGVDRFTIKTLNPSCGSEKMDSELLPDNPKYNRFEYKPGTRERIRIEQHCGRPWVMSNIFSNGDVVPCCYNFDSSIKLGNVNERSFTEIWNGETYRKFRKRLYNDKQSIEMCRYCYISFKMSDTGWIAGCLDLNKKLSFKEKLKSRLGDTPVWPVLQFGKRMAFSGVEFLKNGKRILFPGNSFQKANVQFLPSQTYALQLPLEEDKVSGWKAYGIFNGTTRNLSNLSCHVSVLSPGQIPHEPHMHGEGEILIVLSGIAELVIIDSENKTQRIQQMSPGSFVYYPAGQRHTIRNTTNDCITYLMLKWISEPGNDNKTLDMTIIELPEQLKTNTHQKGFATAVLLDSGTKYLSKLHSHISTLEPGCGYPPHADEYDVCIIVLSGRIKTLGQEVGKNGVIFYAAGEPHGMENTSTLPAKYLVFEFHK
jgi:radical SAM protein with 4Fe4S-binding SPASM domain